MSVTDARELDKRAIESCQRRWSHQVDRRKGNSMENTNSEYSTLEISKENLVERQTNDLHKCKSTASEAVSEAENHERSRSRNAWKASRISSRVKFNWKPAVEVCWPFRRSDVTLEMSPIWDVLCCWQKSEDAFFLFFFFWFKKSLILIKKKSQTKIEHVTCEYTRFCNIFKRDFPSLEQFLHIPAWLSDHKLRNDHVQTVMAGQFAAGHRDDDGSRLNYSTKLEFINQVNLKLNAKSDDRSRSRFQCQCSPENLFNLLLPGCHFLAFIQKAKI